MTKPDDTANGAESPALKLPEQIEEKGMLIGWSLEHEHPRVPIGFNFGDPAHVPQTGYLDPILYEGEGHLMTIAPTGAGKGTGCIIPTLLRHDGPVIVVDPKGENAAVTARRRREMGQKVVVLDPFGISDMESESLNPLDLLDPRSESAVDDAAMLTTMLLPVQRDPKNQYWASRGAQLLTASLLHLAHDHPRDKLTLAGLREMVNQDYEAMQQTSSAMGSSASEDVRTMSASFRIPAPETFGGILSFAQNMIEFARGPAVRRATSDSSLSLDDITRGEPISLFLIVPPEKLESHGKLLRIWIGALIAAITRRRGPPPKRTLLILDEAAQLGQLPQLRQAITLLRGYGLQTWTFWQDVSQLKQLYPEDWQTMVNNCHVQQAFGVKNMNAARDVARLTGFPSPEGILDLDYDEMILLLAGDEAVIAQKPSYLTDPLFKGQFDANPRHDPNAEIMPAPQRPQRHYRRQRVTYDPTAIDPEIMARILTRWAEEGPKPDRPDDPSHDDDIPF